eukprot:UN08699
MLKCNNVRVAFDDIITMIQHNKQTAIHNLKANNHRGPPSKKRRLNPFVESAKSTHFTHILQQQNIDLEKKFEIFMH